MDEHEWMAVGGGGSSEVWRLLLIRGDLVLGGFMVMGCHSGLGPPPGRFFALRVWLHFLWDVCHGVLNCVRFVKRAVWCDTFGCPNHCL